MRIEVKFTGQTEQERFDCVAVLGAVEGDARAERESKMRDAVGGREFSVEVGCEEEAVTGRYPNSECLYHLGSCFE
jgi:hypothetical protein